MAKELIKSSGESEVDVPPYVFFLVYESNSVVTY
jgi:hypothetical protein